MDAAVDDVRIHMDRLRGRLFEALEAMGMPERQEEAAKRLVRRLAYDIQNDLQATLRLAGRPK